MTPSERYFDPERSMAASEDVLSAVLVSDAADSAAAEETVLSSADAADVVSAEDAAADDAVSVPEVPHAATDTAAAAASTIAITLFFIINFLLWRLPAISLKRLSALYACITHKSRINLHEFADLCILFRIKVHK
jgi:hypothetical protein